MPLQEPGTRPARAVPYDLHVVGDVNVSSGTVRLNFRNTGKSAAVFQVRAGVVQGGGPWTYTVGPRAELSDTWALTENKQTQYDLSVYGPNGFLRVFKGSIAGEGVANLHTKLAYDKANCGVTLDILNKGKTKVKVRILDAYTKKTISHAVRPGDSVVAYWPNEKFFGWYDFTLSVDGDTTFSQQLAGHIETGRDSVTDPAIANGIE
jgi:phospholipase C